MNTSELEKKILLFDKYAGYGIGGAQHSFHTLIREAKLSATWLGCWVKKGFHAENFLLKYMPVERIRIFEIPRFPYIEYFLNRYFIRTRIQRHESAHDLLITQGLWGAAAARFFVGKKIYFIRDEYQLNKIPLYQRGIQKYLKCLYILVQLPGVLQLFRDNTYAIQTADILITNSLFLQKEIEKKFFRTAHIIYPIRDMHRWMGMQIPAYKDRPYITLIGNEYMKGLPILLGIAARMEDLSFLVVGRNITTSYTEKNITYMPWTSQIEDVYKQTRILLVPSICAESSPGVALEAQALGIPVVASNQGGIPEILFDTRCLIDDIWNIDAWVDRLSTIERQPSEYGQVPKEYLMRFHAETQVHAFQTILDTVV